MRSINGRQIGNVDSGWHGHLAAGSGEVHMSRPRLVLSVLVLAVAASALPVAAQSRIVIGDPVFTVPEDDPVRSFASLITDALAEGLQNGGQCAGVVSNNDLRSLVDLERLKQMLGADDPNSMLADLVGGIGADTVVTITVGKVGSTYVVNTSAKGSTRTGGASEQSSSSGGVPDAAKKAGKSLGQSIGCGTSPRTAGSTPFFWEGTLTYEVTATATSSSTGSGGTSALEKTAHLRDNIEVRGLSKPVGETDFHEIGKHRLVSKNVSFCFSTGDAEPNSTDQLTTSDTTGGGKIEPSVDISIEDGMLHIVVSVNDELPRLQKETVTATGVSCGKPSPPFNSTHETPDVTTEVEGLRSVDVTVPFDKTQATQAGTKNWPVESSSGLKGTATLTWNLTGK
jgi:hypothetical protein